MRMRLESASKGGMAGLEVVGIEHAERGLIASMAAGAVVVLVAWVAPPEGGAARVAAMLAAYPAMVGLFYAAWRCWGRFLGAPQRLGGVGLGLALAAWFLAVSGDVVLQRLAFWLGQTALMVCGVSAGGGLALVAAHNGCGLVRALSAVMSSKRETAA